MYKNIFHFNTKKRKPTGAHQRHGIIRYKWFVQVNLQNLKFKFE